MALFGIRETPAFTQCFGIPGFRKPQPGIIKTDVYGNDVYGNDDYEQALAIKPGKKYSMIRTAIIWTISLALLVLVNVNCSRAMAPKTGNSSNPKYSTVYDVFSRYDTNADGHLDRHEFHQFQQDPEIIKIRRKIPPLERTLPLIFEEIDENNDEQISLEEMTVITEDYIPKIQ